VSSERRRGRRYIVKGEVRILSGAEEVPGALVNLGQLGMLVRSEVIPPVGTAVTVRFGVSGYPAAFQTEGYAVGSNGDLMAIKFSEEPRGSRELLLWLERENYQWTGPDAPKNAAPMHLLQPGPGAVSRSPKVRDEQKENEEILSFLDGLG
jgi:hypothetical protein